jgi:endogenous inhibitor of DNA gyrase (YacG/DUF329 family)
MAKKLDIICPTCGKKDTWKPENTARPFCSERCKLIDLGEWAAESHCIPGEAAKNDEQDEEDPQ